MTTPDDLIAAVTQQLGLLQIGLDTVVYGSAWEDEDILKALREKDGRPDIEFVKYFSDSLANYRPEGFRAVLPYYLIVAIREPHGDVAERLLIRLGCETKPDQLHFFSHDDCQVLLSCVACICMNSPSDEFMQTYCNRALRRISNHISTTPSST